MLDTGPPTDESRRRAREECLPKASFHERSLVSSLIRGEVARPYLA